MTEFEALGEHGFRASLINQIKQTEEKYIIYLIDKTQKLTRLGSKVTQQMVDIPFTATNPCRVTVTTVGGLRQSYEFEDEAAAVNYFIGLFTPAPKPYELFNVQQLNQGE